MNDIEKVFGLLVQSAVNLVQGIKQVQVRLARVTELRARGGEFGPVLWSFYLLPQRLYRILLSLTTLAGDFDRLWSDPAQRERLLAGIRKVEREPSILGFSSHIISIGRRLVNIVLKSVVAARSAASRPGG